MKNQKGITLIALIITIIVMLILVGVSVTVALNGGLFETAKKAVDDTKIARDEELLIDADGYIAAVQNKIAVGTEVTIGETGENFYVIKDEGTKLILLAKKNIALDAGTQKYKQADGTNQLAFTSGDTSYWASVADESKYPLNLNEYGVCPKGSAIDIARQYAEEITGNRDNGRLMTKEEAEPLSESEDEEILGILYRTYSEGSYLNYWLGSAHNTSSVCVVMGYDSGGALDSQLSSCLFDYDGSSGGVGGYGVRPVLEVSESSVTIVQ